MCVYIELLMHILKPKCYIFVGFSFKGVGGKVFVDVEILMHIQSPHVLFL